MDKTRGREAAEKMKDKVNLPPQGVGGPRGGGPPRLRALSSCHNPWDAFVPREASTVLVTFHTRLAIRHKGPGGCAQVPRPSYTWDGPSPALAPRNTPRAALGAQTRSLAALAPSTLSVGVETAFPWAGTIR